jgi:hypothetical protein
MQHQRRAAETADAGDGHEGAQRVHVHGEVHPLC